MANVIKHKRGSGSDPVASDLVVGEVAIRTDVGKLFTKMDNGSVAEIAGGGSDIAINTLSSSSGTGGGSATFNGSAYRFTLSQPPSVSAQQLLVSINGVIQKPVAGTGQPSEGFSVDGTDIILGDAPATGSDFFILTFKSLGVSEPADNSVTSAKIVDGAIVNADINASAAIAGTKISPDFGSQTITTTGNITTTGDLTVGGTYPAINLYDSNNNPDWRIQNNNGMFAIFDQTNGANRVQINTDGHIDLLANVDISNGLDVTGAITGTGDLTIDTNTLHVDSTNNRVGIGTTSPEVMLDIRANDPGIQLVDTSGTLTYGNIDFVGDTLVLTSRGGSSSDGIIDFRRYDGTTVDTSMRIDSSGRVGIGTSSPSTPLHVSTNTDGTSDLLTLHADADGTNFGIASIKFTGNTGNHAAFIKGGHTTNGDSILTFHTDAHDSGINPQERMRITSDGPHLLLGGTSDVNEITETSANAGMVIGGTGFGNAGLAIITSTSGTGRLYFGDAVANAAGRNRGQINYGHSDDHMRFVTAGTERMRIDSSGNVIVKTNGINLENATATNSRAYSITNAAGTTGWAFGNGIIASAHQFVIYDNTAGAGRMLIDGNGIARFNNGIQLGNGLTNSTAHQLDDYEEGTWSPAVQQGVTNTQTFDSTGRYTKIGRQVYCQFLLQFSGAGTGDRVQFSGLPFTSANNTSRGGGTVLWTNIPGLNDFDFISVIVAGNATNIECYQNMDSNATTGSGGFTNKAFYARFTYEAA